MLSPIITQELRVRDTPNGLEVWDSVRRRWLILSPEEWVRQQLVAHLQVVCGVPFSLMMLEKKVVVGERSRRFDLAVMHRKGYLWLLAECKAPDVPLSEPTLSQALSYLSRLPCRYLLLSNGHQNMLWQLASGTVTIPSDWPQFDAP